MLIKKYIKKLPLNNPFWNGHNAYIIISIQKDALGRLFLCHRSELDYETARHSFKQRNLLWDYDSFYNYYTSTSNSIYKFLVDNKIIPDIFFKKEA